MVPSLLSPPPRPLPRNWKPAWGYQSPNLGVFFLFDLLSGRHPEGQMKELQALEGNPVAEAFSFLPEAGSGLPPWGGLNF